ncbi:MAG: hypothetical protein P8M80_00750 [Pirellulaceae bacterium]|nr:hypothetical protein [Pirellulaceae bacterium]
MTKLIRGAVLAAMACGLLLTQPSVASAQSVKDRAAVVFKISSIDNVLDSVAYMVGEAGFRNFVPAITLGAGAFLEGFDTERPLGGYLTLDGGVPNFVGFLPVDDLGDVIDMLENNGVEIEEDGNDFIVIMPTGEELVIRGKGDWAYYSVNAEMLDDLPADPSKIVGEISDDYVMGLQANIQRIPADLRSQSIEWMEEAFDETYANLPEGAADFQRAINESSLDQIADMIKQTDKIFMGFGTDKKSKMLFSEFTFTGTKGSDLAKSLTMGKNAKTDFSAFLDVKDAAMTLNSVAAVAQQDADNSKATLNLVKDQIGGMIREGGNVDDADAELIEELVGEVLDVLIATLDSGKFDMGAAVVADEDGLNVLGGLHAVQAKKVEAAVKKLVAEKGDMIPPQIDIDLDAETYKGVTFHIISGSIPEEEAQAILGETTTLLVGISASKIYVGFGANPVDKIKGIIDGGSSEAKGKPMQMTITLSPILRMAGKASGEDMMVQMADKLEEEGNQMIRMTSDFIENGQRTRMEMETGILGLIEMGAAGFGGGQFGGDF